MLDVLEKCLITNTDGGVIKRFLDIDHSSCFKKKSEKQDTGNGRKFEEGTVVGLDKIKSDTYRVQFLLKSGFIQLVKDVPSRLPFLIPDKGWAVCTPTKLHDRVSRLQVRDTVFFKVEGEMPQSRGSLQQRLNSQMFNDSDFKTNNLIFPPVPHRTTEPASSRREMCGKLMSHIVSSTVTTTHDKEEVVMSSKMKRSIPGDFRSSVEAGRTGKHGLTDPNDSTLSVTQPYESDASQRCHISQSDASQRCHISQSDNSQRCHISQSDASQRSHISQSDASQRCHISQSDNSQRCHISQSDTSQRCHISQSDTSQRSHISQSDMVHTPNVTISGSSRAVTPYPTSSTSCQATGESDVTSTRHTPVRTIEQSQWYMSRYAATPTPSPSLDRTPMNSEYHPSSSYFNRADLDLTPVNFAESKTPGNMPVQDRGDVTPVSLLQTPIRRRILSKPALSTVTVAKTVSIPVFTHQTSDGQPQSADPQEEEGADPHTPEQGCNSESERETGLAVSVSTESINVTDD